MTAHESQIEGDRAAFSGGRWNLVFAVVLAAAAVLPYGRVICNGFVNYDDPGYVTNNSHVREGLTASTVVWAFETRAVANWHPVTWLSHALDCQIYGLRPAGHHLTNVLIHALNTLLLFYVLGRLTRMPGRSALVAALFAVHPLHVESVAWVAERKDVLSALFGLMAIGAYANYMRRGRKAWWVGMAVALALSLMAKPMFVTLPVILLLLDYWPFRRFGAVPLKVLLEEKTPLFILAALSCVITVYVQHEGRALKTAEELPFLWRIENAVVSYAVYLEKMVWPSGLAVYYPHHGDALAWWSVAGAAAFLAAVSAMAWHWRRSHPYVLVGWLWYLVTLTPVIGILQVGGQAMADRYTYFPLLGIFIALVWGGAEFLDRFPAVRTCGVAVLMVILAVLSLATWRQVGYWRDSVTLFTHALEVTQRNATAHSNLASALLDRRKYNEAEAHSRAALAIQSNYADAHVNLGIALGELGRMPEAVAELKQAASLAPTRADTHFNLGIALVKQGQLVDAEAQLRWALRLNPDDVQARTVLNTLAPVPAGHP